MRTRLVLLVTAVLLLCAVVLVPEIIEAKRAKSLAAASPVQGKKQPMTVGQSIRNDTSPPVREMKQLPVFKLKREANKNPKIQHPHKDAHDPVVQKSIATEFMSANMPASEQNFDGMRFPGVDCNCAPPDTNGEVGNTQFVQSVNEGF